jgi:fructosamine-3-kinase
MMDPAIYFGDSEVELAYIELFGTFVARFFDRYLALRAVARGYEEVRRNVYQLYPLLVHVAAFGASYVPDVQARLVRIESHV